MLPLRSIYSHAETLRRSLAAERLPSGSNDFSISELPITKQNVSVLIRNASTRGAAPCNADPPPRQFHFRSTQKFIRSKTTMDLPMLVELSCLRAFFDIFKSFRGRSKSLDSLDKRPPETFSRGFIPTSKLADSVPLRMPIDRLKFSIRSWPQTGLPDADGLTGHKQCCCIN